MEENKTEQADEMVSVPKGSTVNKDKFERMQKRAEDAEAQIQALQEQVKALTATSEEDKKAVEEFKAKIAEDSEKYAAERAAWEAESVRKDKANELLQAGCIDTESALASLHEGMTVEALKEAKPHLFMRETKASSAPPADKSPEDTFEDTMRQAFGLKQKG